MLSYNDAFYDLANALKQVYDEHESAAIAHEVLEHITGMNKMQRLMYKEDMLTQAQSAAYHRMKAELLTARPLQYVLGYAWFMGKKFKVNEHVLIPRPETEELVECIVSDWKDKNPNASVLDIGTGSACIPISLKSALPDANVTACDISKDAIAVASENAGTLNTDVKFLALDFLDRNNWQQLPKYDVIVSNPPYIPDTEKESLHTNVRDHEPHLALFTPGDDPLLFYKAIAEFGKSHLNQGGVVYCELHAFHAISTGDWFRNEGYKDINVRKDMHGNMRILRASL